MNVIVNKKTISIVNEFTLMKLLNQLNYSNSVAVFVNNKQLLLSEYDDFRLKANDNIRIIKPLGGG